MSGNGIPKTGIAGGTLTIILANINGTDMLKTAILAAIGAIVSVFVSWTLKMLIAKWRTRK